MRRSYPKKIKSTVDFVQFLSKITWNSNRCFMHASFVLTCLVMQSCLIVIPWTVAFQAPLSLGFSRQEYWSRLPFPSPGISQPGDRTSVSWCLLHCRLILYPLSHWGLVALAFPVHLSLFFTLYFSNWDSSITKGSSWIYEHTHTRQGYAALKRKVKKAEKNTPKPRYKGTVEKQHLVKAWEFIISHSHLYHCQIHILT